MHPYRRGMALSLLLAIRVAAYVPISAQAPPADRPAGTLNDIMRGVFFPSSNVIFDVQVNDPSAPITPTNDGDLERRYASTYTRWQQVEYAAVALADGVDLLLTPERRCQNGAVVPTDAPQYRRYAEDMRAIAQEILTTARTRDRDRVSEATTALTDACANCHNVYRRGNADSQNRCMATK